MAPAGVRTHVIPSTNLRCTVVVYASCGRTKLCLKVFAEVPVSGRVWFFPRSLSLALSLSLFIWSQNGLPQSYKDPKLGPNFRWLTRKETVLELLHKETRDGKQARKHFVSLNPIDRIDSNFIFAIPAPPDPAVGWGSPHQMFYIMVTAQETNQRNHTHTHTHVHKEPQNGWTSCLTFPLPSRNTQSCVVS